MVGSSKALAAAVSLALASVANGYWLMGLNVLTVDRLDPIVNPDDVARHVHTIFGGSNFGPNSLSTKYLQQSECTSAPILEDKSNYWAPTMYFQWANGSFSRLNGGAVTYYLFPDQAGTTTAFPHDFRMISGKANKRSHAGDSAAKAVDFLCLDFSGQTTKHDELPKKKCPSGIRAQVNFQSCWNGKDVDSPDHMSHVAYRSGGPDSGECNDPKFPINLPRIFMEIYWDTPAFKDYHGQAMDPNQPFVFSNGDPTGYGYHADFVNGWDDGVLQRAVDGCNCDRNGDPQCCADKGVFTLVKNKEDCKISRQVDEDTAGMLPALPGNNPIQPGPQDAISYTSDVTPALRKAIVYRNNAPERLGEIITPGSVGGGAQNPPPPPPTTPSNTPAPAPPSSSSNAPAPTSAPSVAPAPPASGSSSQPPRPSSQSTTSVPPSVTPAPQPVPTVPVASTTVTRPHKPGSTATCKKKPARQLSGRSFHRRSHALHSRYNHL